MAIEKFMLHPDSGKFLVTDNGFAVSGDCCCYGELPEITDCSACTHLNNLGDPPLDETTPYVWAINFNGIVPCEQPFILYMPSTGDRIRVTIEYHGAPFNPNRVGWAFQTELQACCWAATIPFACHAVVEEARGQGWFTTYDEIWPDHTRNAWFVSRVEGDGATALVAYVHLQFYDIIGRSISLWWWAGSKMVSTVEYILTQPQYCTSGHILPPQGYWDTGSGFYKECLRSTESVSIAACNQNAWGWILGHDGEAAVVPRRYDPYA